ncbi:MAG: enoyl-CoA hydratase [Porphyrobacter sp. IPPAS B-1204]|nr:MAG: enoyl-CoA hydratase [Porphyrobacter sp. IPPAS B-1204]
MSDAIVPKVDQPPVYETDEPVLYAAADGIARMTLNRPQFHNVQNSQMTYALDDAFKRAVDDDDVKVIILKSDAKHFTAGHDIGSPGRDFHSSFDRRLMWYDHSNKGGAEKAYIREQEVYLGMCKRWRALPKPTVAQVHGACIAGGLMLAWVCDLIIASDDAFFQDPVLQMGFPGVEYFAHAHELNPRIAKEFLFLGERMSAERAYQMGMVNRVVPRADLEAEVARVAARIAEQPRLALQLAKQAVNHMETLAGKEAGIDASFGYHHFAHANNQLVSGDYIAGFSGKSMAEKNKEREAGKG